MIPLLKKENVQVWDKAPLGKKWDPLGIAQKIKIRSKYQWYMHKLEFIFENKTHMILWDFQIKTDYLILDKRPELMFIKKKQIKLSNGFWSPGGCTERK